MRIALLAHLHHPITEPFLGGLEMHTAIVADELVRRGHTVTLFAQQGSQTAADLVPLVDRDFRFGAMLDRDGVERSADILHRAVLGAVESIREGGYDLVFNNSLGPLPYTELADQVMLTVLHTPPTLAKVNAVVERPDWRPGPRHGWVAVSEFTAAMWRTRLPHVGCVLNGIRLGDWTDGGDHGDDLAVWAARITPEKGLDLAIAAAREAGMPLEISGPIADQRYFTEVVEPMLGDDVRYIGHVDHAELVALHNRGSVFIASPLWPEPFGLAMVEAMACGTPVAALPNGAAAEIVGDDGGSVAREVTVDALAQAMKTAGDLDHSTVRAWAQRYDAQAMVDAYERTMAKLLG